MPDRRSAGSRARMARARANAVTINDVGVSGRRLLEPARAASLFKIPSRNLGEPGNFRPFMRLLGSTSCGNRPVRRGNLSRDEAPQLQIMVVAGPRNQTKSTGYSDSA